MILCIGDSFTYGEELSDTRNAWPNLLADSFYGVDVLNLGKSGASNDWIFTTAVERTVWERYDVIIVQWTERGRVDLSICGADIQGVNPSTQRLNKVDKKWLDKYYKEFYDDNYAWQRTITQIIALQNHFKRMEQPYVMTSMNTILEKRSMFYAVGGVLDTETFLEPLTQMTYNCDKGPGGHPLEAGHQAIAKRMEKHLNENFNLRITR